MRALNLLQKGLNEVHCDTALQIQTGPGLAVTTGIITPAQLLPSRRCDVLNTITMVKERIAMGKTEALENFKVQTTIQCIRHSGVIG